MGKQGNNKGGENGQKGGQKGNGSRGRDRDGFMKIIIQMLTNMLITVTIIIEGRIIVDGVDGINGCIRVLRLIAHDDQTSTL